MRSKIRPGIRPTLPTDQWHWKTTRPGTRYSFPEQASHTRQTRGTRSPESCPLGSKTQRRIDSRSPSSTQPRKSNRNCTTRWATTVPTWRRTCREYTQWPRPCPQLGNTMRSDTRPARHCRPDSKCCSNIAPASASSTRTGSRSRRCSCPSARSAALHHSMSRPRKRRAQTNQWCRSTTQWGTVSLRCSPPHKRRQRNTDPLLTGPPLRTQSRAGKAMASRVGSWGKRSVQGTRRRRTS